MNVKQFKRRFLHGMIEPELFYLPVVKKEQNKKGTLTIRLYSSKYYDVDTNEFILDQYSIKGVYGAIVVKNSSGRIVYNSRKSIGDRIDGNDDRFYFAIENLPYDKYSVKVIRSAWAQPDTEWHDIVLNNDSAFLNIFLNWQPDSVFIIDCTRDIDYNVPCEVLPHDMFLKNLYSSTVLITKCEGKGCTFSKLYEGFDRHKLLCTRPKPNYAIKDYDKNFFDTNVIVSKDADCLYSFTDISYYSLNEIVKASTKTVRNNNFELEHFYCKYPEVSSEKYVNHSFISNRGHYSPVIKEAKVYTTTNAYPGSTDFTFYSLREIEWEAFYEDLAIDGNMSGIAHGNSFANIAGESPKNLVWYDSLKSNYSAYMYDDTFAYYSFLPSNVKKYLDNKANAADFIEGYDVGIIVMEGGKQYCSNKTEYEAQTKEYGDKVLYKTVIKNYYSDYPDAALETVIGKSAVKGEALWFNQELGIQYHGRRYDGRGTATFVHDDVQPALTTTYVLVGRMMYSDDYHDYDPT